MSFIFPFFHYPPKSQIIGNKHKAKINNLKIPGKSVLTESFALFSLDLFSSGKIKPSIQAPPIQIIITHIHPMNKY